MSDIQDWPSLIRIESVPARTHPEIQIHYVVVPLNEYQIGNLLGLLKKGEDTGDWFLEMWDILLTAMKVAGITEVIDNDGNVWTQDSFPWKIR